MKKHRRHSPWHAPNIATALSQRGRCDRHFNSLPFSGATHHQYPSLGQSFCSVSKHAKTDRVTVLIIVGGGPKAVLESGHQISSATSQGVISDYRAWTALYENQEQQLSLTASFWKKAYNAQNRRKLTGSSEEADDIEQLLLAVFNTLHWLLEQVNQIAHFLERWRKTSNY